MKPYTELSSAGKLCRLRGLAAAALTHYELKDPEMVFFRFETNLLYRVTAPSGERFMLRLATPGWRTLEDLQSEAMWLNALARDCAVPVPAILPTRSGEVVLPVCHPGVPQAWNATLMSWVPGRLLGYALTEGNLSKMGKLFAELHYHGAAWIPPAGFTTRRFEHWLSRGEENRIIASVQPTAFPPPQGGLAALPPDLQNLLERMHRHVELAYAAVDRSDLRVIHADLWHNNIKLYRGVLHPLDFEDTVWGFRAHDIGMSMLDLLEATDEAQYGTLLAAFRRGYETRMAWPEDPIEPFQIGRILWKINWVARREPQWLKDTIERYVPVFEHYERTGQIILPPPR